MSIQQSLCCYNKQLCSAWKGAVGDDKLWILLLDGTTWDTPVSIPSTTSPFVSSVGPSLAVFNSNLYAAWKGSGDDQSIYYASFNGLEWSAQATISDVASNIGPTLSECNGTLYAMWNGGATTSVCGTRHLTARNGRRRLLFPAETPVRISHFTFDSLT